MVISLYRAASILAGPLVPVLLRRRERQGKEDPARRDERLGIASRPRPDGPLIWVHAASVGESLAALPVIERLLAEDPERHVLVTTHTVTSAKLMADRLPPRGLHQAGPFDRPGYVRRFLDHWRPDAALWMESELWPNMLGSLRQRGIPAALLNARLSARSAARWRRLARTWRTLTEGFDLIQPSSRQAEAVMRELGVTRFGPAGNLKFAADAPPVDTAKAEALRQAIGGRPVWAAASTHPGEEAMALAAHDALRAHHPGALLVLIPRHPDRGAEVARLAGGAAPRRSAGALPAPDDPVYVADTMGEMGTLLSVSPVVFVGGSLVPVGGHNPLEPARLGAAVLAGPHVDNFADIYADLQAADAYRHIEEASLPTAVGELLTEPALRQRLVDAAATVTARQSALLDQIMQALRPVLPAPRARAAE